ncbi:hypothetical protein O181_078471 [Austropuccinia psidii MF-1]|uniref:Reverse transcriptase/retrotransposon-derived protein RNase H-like domain-containing protein n=1 Tax=Austropuccinia psidii MF-1 TaxID=1389203 RepID=A0A9Q3FED3_9BASI|nr:hypothetical protein [Austropuccinia psidii MF-1]
MDLTTSSYHDSLEELWDEEEDPEEIETMMKVVPSAYHKYLDVFSKVKAEKPPPHHACDHDIELKGSLPPKVSSTQRGFHHCSNHSLTTIVETDASDYALGAVLSQVTDTGKHPIAFDSHKHIPSERNYEIHEKELLDIVWVSRAGERFSFLFLPLLKFSPIIVHFNFSCHQRFSLAVKPSGLNFSLNSIPKSLNALAAWLPFQMHCQIGTKFTQRGGKI